MKPVFVFYVTSHGFGHSTRAIEVIEHLPDSVDVEIVTAAPEWLFDKSIKRPFRYVSLLHDCGIVQPDSINMNLPATIERWQGFIIDYPRMVEQEATRLKQSNPVYIVGDISPFACLVAEKTGLKSAIVANFTWDWIFEEYLKDEPGFSPVISAIQDCYRKADVLLQTPLSESFPAFQRIEQIPLIVRHARNSRKAVRETLGVSDEKKLAVISFGGMGLNGIPRDVFERYSDWVFITFDPAFEGIPNTILVDGQEIYHPDLVNACDAAIAKLGYGLATECIAHQTPIVYLPREGFREHGVIEREAGQWVGLHRIESERFYAGDWSVLDQVEPKRKQACPVACNGGETAARYLLNEAGLERAIRSA